jgi:hypothetical protein
VSTEPWFVIMCQHGMTGCVALCYRVAFRNNYTAADVATASIWRNCLLEGNMQYFWAFLTRSSWTHEIVKIKGLVKPGVPFVEDEATAWKSGK